MAVPTAVRFESLRRYPPGICESLRRRLAATVFMVWRRLAAVAGSWKRQNSLLWMVFPRQRCPDFLAAAHRVS